MNSLADAWRLHCCPHGPWVLNDGAHWRQDPCATGVGGNPPPSMRRGPRPRSACTWGVRLRRTSQLLVLPEVSVLQAEPARTQGRRSECGCQCAGASPSPEAPRLATGGRRGPLPRALASVHLEPALSFRLESRNATTAVARGAGVPPRVRTSQSSGLLGLLPHVEPTLYSSPC